MTVRLAAGAALLLAAAGCGGGEPSAKADLTVSATRTNTAADGGSNVSGKLAPNLGPPSTLIILEPQGAAELPVKTEPAIMDQAGYEFLPAFLTAQAGQLVQFRNSEDILHNVRVTDIATQMPVFNVATLAFGKYEHKFEPGFYNVTCDIHSTMHASILVTASPYTATTADDGSFAIPDVKAGQYNLTIYTGAAPVVRAIEVKGGKTDLGVIQ
jgi:plastocyanin